MGASLTNHLLPEEYDYTVRGGELYRYGTALVVIFNDDLARTLKGDYFHFIIFFIFVRFTKEYGVSLQLQLTYNFTIYLS